MNNHGHKKPPLQSLLNHIGNNSANIVYWLSLVCLGLLFGITIAGAFDV